MAPRRHGLTRSLPLLVVAAAVLVLLAGTAAAFAFPVISVTPEKTVAEMLPATTVAYLSADLNPAGAVKRNLNRIERDFTSEPGWSRIAATLNSTTKGSAAANRCFRQTQGNVTDHLKDLGHRSAFAVIAAPGRTLSTGLENLQHDMVFLASLDVHMTLVQALGGFSLSLQQRTSSYRGTTIYQESFPSCGAVSTSAPTRVYAALFKGYVVLGLRPDPIERIIDTGSGRVPALASVRAYGALMTQLPVSQLGGYYLNAKALKDAGVLGALRTLPGASLPPSTYNQALKPTAGALTVGPDGFRLVAAAYAPSGAPHHRNPAGLLAAQLPSGTLAFLSIQDAASTADAALRQLTTDPALSRVAHSSTPLVRDITADLSGEADLVLLPPRGAMNLTTAGRGAGIPLSLVWQVRDGRRAAQHLDDLTRRLGLSGQFTPGRTADGTTYQVNRDGYGYAIRQGWAVASLAIRRTIDSLSPAGSLASSPAYRTANAPGITPSSVWYVNLRGLRRRLEASILPAVGSSTRLQYEQYARPVVNPLRSLTGSAGISRDGRFGISTIFLGIGSRQGS